MTLSEAFQFYVRQMPKDAKQLAQPEIAKFVRWAGADRLITTLVPSEIGEYSDTFGARATSSDANVRLSTVKLFLSFLKKKGHVETNLSQHLRIRKARSSAKSRSMTGRQEIKLTRAGYNDMTKQLASLQKQRVQLAEDIQRAAADGDVRENAPLEAARENQGMVVSKIREIESTLKAAVVLDDGTGEPTERVQIGAKLKLTETSSGRSINYQLVEPNEASPLNGKISILSPVGAAILSRRVGEQVTVVTPRGEQVYRIDSVN
jgi:transcription elongation factor GreA